MHLRSKMEWSVEFMENKPSKGLKIKHANVVLGIVFILLAAAIFLICQIDGLKFYHNKAPGPGFMPMISAAIIGICGVGITIGAFSYLRKKEINLENENEKVIATIEEWKSFFIIIGIGAATVVITPFLGLITTLTASIILLIRFLGPEPWKTSIIVGLVTGIIMYLIFVVFLKVHVPKGPFGF